MWPSSSTPPAPRCSMRPSRPPRSPRAATSARSRRSRASASPSSADPGRRAGPPMSSARRRRPSDMRDPRVDTYIAPLPEWQQALCEQLRDLVHEADPEVQETIKRTVQPYFVLDGNVCALLAAKDHVNLF